MHVLYLFPFYVCLINQPLSFFSFYVTIDTNICNIITILVTYFIIVYFRDCNIIVYLFPSYLLLLVLI